MTEEINTTSLPESKTEEPNTEQANNENNEAIIENEAEAGGNDNDVIEEGEEAEAGENEEEAEESLPKNDPLKKAQEPVSFDMPTQLELDASVKLEEFLRKNDCYESEERAEKRKEVLIELQEITNEFVRLAAVQNKVEPEIEGVPVQCQLFPFGSYRLGVCNTTSDIDCLCITPRFVTRNDFFRILHSLLDKNPKVVGLQKIESAFVPILTMEYDTIDIDISFASLDMDTVTDQIDLSDDSLLNNLDMHAYMSINGVRTNDMLLQLLPNVENFRTLLRFIRLWSKKRAIYGNVYGYLGGVNLALLAAFICQRYPNAPSATLVLMFFYELMDWEWPNPIYINTPNQGPLESWDPSTSQDVMPIITPSYPCINSTRSASKSTLHRMTEEFKLGFKLTNSIISKKKKWKKLIDETNFFTLYKTYIRIEISADSQKSFDIWEGAVESKIKRLALDLEKEENIQYAVTYPHCFEKSEDPSKKFPGSFFIGMVFKKPADPNQKVSIDVTHVIQSFLSFLMTKVKEKTQFMLVNPQVIKKMDVPLFVFPNGERPDPKKPKGKKVPKKSV